MEVLTGKRYLARENDAAVMLAALTATPTAPSTLARRIPESLDRITLRGLAHSPEKRFRTAEDMALALEQALDLAMPSEIGAWVQRTAKGTLTERALRVANVENASGGDVQFRSSTPPAQEPSRTVLAAASARSATSATPAERGKFAMPILLPLLAVGIVALAAFARFAVSSPSGHATPPVTTTTSGDPDPAAPIQPDPAPPSTDRPGLTAVPFDSLPSATPSAVPSPSPAAAATAASDAHPRAPAAPARGASAPPPAKHGSNGANCDPPFRVDSTGRKIFKIECL